MKITQYMAKHLREIYEGGSWTGVHLRGQLKGLDWKAACRSSGSGHSIAELVFHMNYYIDATIRFLREDELHAKDELSFDMPVIDSEATWAALVSKSFEDAEALAKLIERLDDSILGEHFAEPKQGNYYRNLSGLVEHCNYHLGQIALLKKWGDE